MIASTRRQNLTQGTYNERTPSLLSMTEQQNAQEFNTHTKRNPMKKSEKIFLGVLLFAISAVLFIRFVPVSFIGVDVVALSPGSAPTTIEKINIEGTDTFEPQGEIKFTTVTIESDSLTIWEWFQAKNDEIRELRDRPVSYTHLTLPTILLV